MSVSPYLVVGQLRATAVVGMNRSVCNRQMTPARDSQDESIADVAIKTMPFVSLNFLSEMTEVVSLF